MKRSFSYFVIILLSIAALLATQLSRQQDSKDLSVSFLNVGQGDSALIQKDDFQILIDGGPNNSLLPEIGQIMPPLDHKIDLIILSHPHADHISGLNAILDRYEIGEIYFTGVIFSSAQYISFLDKIKNKQIPLIVPSLNASKSFAQSGSINFLWPGDRFSSKSEDNLNNTSLVTRICYFSSCVLFMGDLEKDGQAEMLAQYAGKEDLLKSDIIKIPHHGSNNALLPALYELVRPQYAVIEVGKDNQFGHPHQTVIDYLKEKSIQAFRTDQDGVIRFNLSQAGVSRF